jgi:hypothetical protein
VKALIMVFWVVMPCSLVGSYHCFGGTSALNMKAIQSSEMMVTTYKTAQCHILEDHSQ